jgi:Zn-dependent protease
VQGGFLHLFYWRKVPVQLHWTVLALVGYAALERTPFFELIGGGTVVLVHELGHAVLVRRYGLRVRKILIHPFGGECVHDATESIRQRVVIAWGGVLAQGVLFVLGFVLAQLGFLMRVAPVREFLLVLIGYNVFVAAFNLLPIRPLDGYMAWKLKYLRRAPALVPVGRKKIAPKPRPVSPIDRRKLDLVIDAALEEARSKASSKDE